MVGRGGGDADGGDLMSPTGPPRFLHLVFGPAEHGVTTHALALARAAGEPVLHLAVPSPPPPALVLAQLADAAGPGRPVHLHVTDRLLGRTAQEGALLVEMLAAARPVTVTLHDLPQPSDGRHYPSRRSAYRRIARAAAGVQVSSRYEAALLRAVDPDVVPVLVALPIQRPAVPPPVGDRPRLEGPTVAVLGFLYPGKGHDVVLEALERLGRPDVGLVALGRPSDGHEWLVDELTRRAGGRRLLVTGYLADAALDGWLLAVDVPVMAPTHVSASGSVHRWIGAGRRPVALRTPYTAELEAARPGCLRLTDDLPAAIGRALDDPADTWLDRSYDWDAADAAAAQTAAIVAALAGPGRPS